GVVKRDEPPSGERFFRRSAAHVPGIAKAHGLQPWLHSYAAPRLKPLREKICPKKRTVLNSYKIGIISKDTDCKFSLAFWSTHIHREVATPASHRRSAGTSKAFVQNMPLTESSKAATDRASPKTPGAMPA